MKKFICIFMLMLSYFFIYSYDFSLSSIETDMNDVTVYRGKSMQTVSNKNFLISMLATKTSYGIQFSTSITNYSGNDYLFKENCISVYQGNFEESYWEKIEYIPALTYYNNAIAKAKTELVITGIASAFDADWGVILRERGSTGVANLKVSAGVIDSGFRNQWFVCLYNGNDKPLYIAKYLDGEQSPEDKDAVVYPYSKAIAQALVIPVPHTYVEEIEYDELVKIPSERGLGMLGSSNK